MTVKVEDHLLTGALNGKDVKQDPCTGKDSGEFGGDLPDTIVVHFTAGPSLASAVNTLKNPDVKASAHLVIERDASTSQLIPFNRIAWHAGKSSWKNRTGINRYSIGIELVNAGELQPSGDKYMAWFGRRYEPDEVINAVHRNQSSPLFWHAYTPEQIEACFEICRVLKTTYSIAFILGHEEIAPRRKTDPGPAFPLDKLRDQLLTGRDDHEEPGAETAPDVDPDFAGDNRHVATVAASRLNFRQQPNASAMPAGEPLERGERVEVLEQSGSWYKVRVFSEGWVHGDYLDIQD